jgi:hypothetical protein
VTKWAKTAPDEVSHLRVGLVRRHDALEAVALQTVDHSFGHLGVGPARHRLPRHPRNTYHILNPGFVSNMAFYALVSIVCQAHCPPRHRMRFERLFLELKCI